jgi:hypothetical protein
MTRQVTHSAADLLDLKRSSDPNKLIVQLAPDRAGLRAAEEEEYRRGIVYDDHVIGGFPLTRTLPVIDRWRSLRRADDGEWLPPGWSGRTDAVFDVPLRELKAAAGVTPKAFNASESGSSRVTLVALSAVPKDPYDYGGKYTLQLEPTIGKEPVLKCEIPECIANRINVIGWSTDGVEIFYLAYSLEGRPGSGNPGASAIYAWNPHANVVRLIHDSGEEGLRGRLYNLEGPTGISFEASPLIGREIVVAFAGADQPPRLEVINLDTGSSRILFDPNAEMRSLTRGKAVWHTWENSLGYSGRGIMVLPDDYRAGERYPGVITTYGCGNGFLRGGSGDNAPEFVLAHQGFIAICDEFPIREILAREADQSRIYPIYCDIVLGLIADLTKEGKLDPARVGLSGQSLGANAGAQCISHSNAIAAAAFRHGSWPERIRWELFTTDTSQHGPDAIYARMNLPDPRNDPQGKWDAISVSHHARDINTPILLQLDDSEYLGALPLWSAMREEDKAIEMDVFPEETHQLMQPIHMLVNFERQLDWFGFWLNHGEDGSPLKRDQYDRWNRLRDSIHKPPPQP